jgi:hypothetical protein
MRERGRERERKERDALGAPSAASFSPPPRPARLLIGRPRGRRWLAGDGVEGVGEEQDGRGLEAGGGSRRRPALVLFGGDLGSEGSELEVARGGGRRREPGGGRGGGGG